MNHSASKAKEDTKHDVLVTLVFQTYKIIPPLHDLLA